MPLLWLISGCSDVDVDVDANDDGSDDAGFIFRFACEKEKVTETMEKLQLAIKAAIFAIVVPLRVSRLYQVGCNSIEVLIDK